MRSDVHPAIATYKVVPTYDANGNPTRVSYPSGSSADAVYTYGSTSNAWENSNIVVDLSYNLAYRNTLIRAHHGAMDDTSITYAEDADGRYTQRVIGTKSSGEQDELFKYDALDRLTCRTTSTHSSCPGPGHHACPSTTTPRSKAGMLRGVALLLMGILSVGACHSGPEGLDLNWRGSFSGGAPASTRISDLNAEQKAAVCATTRVSGGDVGFWGPCQ